MALLRFLFLVVHLYRKLRLVFWLRNPRLNGFFLLFLNLLWSIGGLFRFLIFPLTKYYLLNLLIILRDLQFILPLLFLELIQKQLRRPLVFVYLLDLRQFFLWGAGVIVADGLQLLYLGGVFLQLLLGLMILFLQLLEILVLFVYNFLQVYYVSLLVTAVLRIIRRSHKELQCNGVISLIEVAFSVEQIDSIEPIVAPALAHLEVACEFSHNLGSWVAMVDHLHPVLVLLGLGVWQALEHF